MSVAYAVLALLMTHAGQTLSRATIVEHVWDYSFEGYSNVVDVSTRRLREAIDRGHEHEQQLIQTVRGLWGYKIKAP